jgi:myo-inositol-1(or 4)-monophosphatase
VPRELSEVLRVAERAARAGAAVLESRYLDATIEPELKGEHDFVSVADRESEAVIIETILGAFPDHDILAEESGQLVDSGAEYEWVIDPLDGTTNFLQGLPMFAVSIACRRAEETVVGVILDPVHGNLFTAARGQGAHQNGRPISVSTLPDAAGAYLATGYPFRAREALDLYLEVFREVFLRARALRRCGSAALDLAFTASGVFDGFFEFRLSPWDIAAGALLIEEAGGRVSDLDGGGRYLETGNVLAGGAGVFAELRQRVGGHASEARLDELVPRLTSSTASAC